MNAHRIEHADPDHCVDIDEGREAIVDYYTEAGADYAAWSPRWNMHFGFPRRPWDVFHRERMLDHMNDLVVDRVLARPRAVGETRLADLGCGLGATMRRGADRYSDIAFDGFTVVDWQIENGRALTEEADHSDRVQIRMGDYLDLPVPDDHYDGAYALESSCYAPGPSKAAFVAEAARVLKPGARLVIADGFRIDSGRPFSRFGEWLYRTLCNAWAIDEFADAGEFVHALEQHGFDEIEVEDLSLRIAWSVMWVPFVTMKFYWDCWRRGELVAGWRASNVVGSLLAMMLGLMRWRFRYLIVSARRSTERSRATRPNRLRCTGAGAP